MTPRALQTALRQSRAMASAISRASRAGSAAQDLLCSELCSRVLPFSGCLIGTTRVHDSAMVFSLHGSDGSICQYRESEPPERGSWHFTGED